MSKFVKVVERDNGDCICINLDQVVLVDEFNRVVVLNTNEQKYKKIWWLDRKEIKKIMREMGV